MPLKPDDTLLNGQYRILRLLERGGFGSVYQAQDTLLRDQVAIRELISALVGDETTLKRFLAEARATLRLAHVMNADGSGQTRLTNNPADDYGPC